MNKISGIYKIRNIIDNKIYIGSSVNIKSRIRSHKYNLRNNKHYNKHLQNAWNKYGEDNFKFEIVERVEFDEYYQLLEIECKWICKTKCYDNNIGYNIEQATNDLGRYKFKTSEETKEKLRNKIITDEMRQNMRNSQFKKPIIQFDLDGTIVSSWSGAREASKALGMNQSCIHSCLIKKRRTYKGFIWVYKDEYANKGLCLSDYINKPKQPIKIAQCSLDGKLIKVLPSASAAASSIGSDSSSIVKCCKHKINTVKKYIFIYYSEYETHGVRIHAQANDKRSSSRNRAVLQMDLNGNVLNRFERIKDALEYTGLKSLTSCLSGRTKTAGGFLWKYDV